MKKIAMDRFKSSVNHPKEYQKKKTVVLLLLTTLLFFSAACSLFHSEKDEGDFQKEIISMIGTQDVSEPITTEASDGGQEPLQQPEQPRGSESSIVGSGPSGFTVSAENFNCVCQEVSGIVTQELRVVEDHLEIVEADGSKVEYEKTGENTYRRSWMGYYILKTEGDDTETKVDREEWVVVTLMDDGYSMSQYREDESSPCCIHTFKQAD